MTDKTMPERIYAMQPPTSILRTWMEGDSRGGVEYIRADLVPAPSSADEPLADGQFRWFKEDKGLDWDFGDIEIFEGEAFIDVGTNIFPVSDVFKIGPVVRPPANTD